MENPSNQLIHATSPYLLQHAHNPVNWYPWGPDALGKAVREDKPILLSIGYAACHWCHVMERESFENEAVAALMNASFVCIKVDREERPDLDSIYMAATQAMNQGRGGWPMTVFLAPDTRPFFAGTYFPPEDRHGMPGFSRVLTQLSGMWRDERATLLGHAEELTASLRNVAQSPAAKVSSEVRGKTLQHLHSDFDATFGGFGPAPKFPHATTVQWLLRQAAETGDAAAAHMASKTLDGMAQGGMFDHIGGGFARYSTDPQWLVPHFEKMLYDNASLAQAYAEAFVITGEARFAEVARATLDFVGRELTDSQGGFYTSYDADSLDAAGVSVEGAFYVWTPGQVAEVVGSEQARRLCAFWDITEAGNFEGQSIPNTPRPLQDVASELGISAAELSASVDAGRKALRQARSQRAAPGLDDKILTAWNGLMISAFAVGARLLAEPAYLAQAQKAAQFVWQTLRTPEGKLLRTCRKGRAHLNAYLEDYAYLSMGLIDLYEAGGGAIWLQRAQSLAECILTDFIDADSGAFFDTAQDHETLLMRVREGHDGATPNANATAAWALARLAVHGDKPAWQQAAARAIEAYGSTMARAPWAFCQALLAYDCATGVATEAVLLGDFASPDYQRLWRATQAQWAPRAAWVHHTGDAHEPLPPLALGKKMLGDRPTLYVCRDHACSAPVTDAAAAHKVLQMRLSQQ